MVKKKNIRDININIIIQTNNIFLNNILMFCDNKNKSKSSILLFFIKLKNIRSQLIFLFFDFYFSI